MKIKRILTFVLLLALTVILGGEVFLSAFAVEASAAAAVDTGDNYSGVIDDLNEDPNFNSNNYPEVTGSYSISLIRIGESDTGELFVYLYQPGFVSNEYYATHITISHDKPWQEKDVNALRYYRYELEHMDGEGVFHKYRVKDFVAPITAPYRYYTIGMIQRRFISGVDNSQWETNLDGISFYGIVIGTSYGVHDDNDITVYESASIDIVQVFILASGSIRYSDGFQLKDLFIKGAVDRHYIGIKIGNYDVHKIYDLDMSYTINHNKKFTNHTAGFLGGGTYETVESTTYVPSRFISDSDTGKSNATGWSWFSRQYEWNRIMTVDEFCDDVSSSKNFVEAQVVRQQLLAKGCDYVISFLETDYQESYVPGTDGSGGVTNELYSTVSNASVIRLHFLSHGKTYNLGAVSDGVDIDSDPELEIKPGDHFVNNVKDALNMDGDGPNWLMIILLILLVVLVVVLLPYIAGPIGALFKLVAIGLKTVFVILKKPFEIISRELSARKKEKKTKKTAKSSTENGKE